MLNINLETDVSFDSVQHLVGRIDANASDFYQDYRKSEQRLAGRPLKMMSNLTKAILHSVDYTSAKLLRERNFFYLHDILKSQNKMNIFTGDICGPMVYPLWTNNEKMKDKLIAENIYVATYWKEVLQRPCSSLIEIELVTKLVPLPIDQRYELQDMQVILDIVQS
jgi:hypothetical protein